MGRRRIGRAAVTAAACVTLSACSEPGTKREAASSAESRRERAGDRAAGRPVDMTIRFHAVGMPAKVTASSDFEVDKKSLALALDAARPALVACHAGRPLSKESPEGPGATWLTMKVSDKGEASNVQAVRSSTPDESGKCASDVLAKIAYSGQTRPFALGVWLEVFPKEARPPTEPPEPTTPADASAPAGDPLAPDAPRKATGGPAPPPGACRSDNVLAYLPVCEQAARGGMWSDDVLETFGGGGLGLSGAGGPAPIGTGSLGTPSGGGQGLSGGILGGKHKSKPPQVRMGAGVTVTGRLPKEVIQRIVRQNFGRFRLCYENALRSDPTIAGNVTVAFTIATDGSVSKVGHTTTMSDPGTGDCVHKAFLGLSFPQPEGGVVNVTYPISFAPGDFQPEKVSSVLGMEFAKLTGPSLAAAATKEQVVAASVEGDPGSDVPFVVFVDRLGDHYAVVRTPKGVAGPPSYGLFGDDFNVFVVPAGSAKPSTAFLK